MLDRDSMSVEVLQRQVAKERDLVVLVESNIYVVLAGALGLRGHLV